MLRNRISDVKTGIAEFSPIPLPLDPTIIVTGVNSGIFLTWFGKI